MVQSVLDVTRRKEFRSTSVYRDALAKFSPPQSSNSEPNKTINENPLVDEYFEYVAFTGRPSIPWSEIRAAFLWKIETVMNTMHIKETEQEPDSRVKEQLLKSESIQASKKFILQKAESFEGTPFTIQRLCELITTPTRHYHITEKFLRALEKNINVVTTVTESGERLTGIDDCDSSERESPIPVERNFIVSVDELDDPLPTLTNGVIGEKKLLPNGPANAENKDALCERTPLIDSSEERPIVSTSTEEVEPSSSISSSSRDDENVQEAEQSHMDISPEKEGNSTGSAESMEIE